MESPKVTIAVAIYNVPNEYLSQCINSLIHQSLEDIEILLISDNSNHGNLELITEYEKDIGSDCYERCNCKTRGAEKGGLWIYL